jgi:hypothetical protein
MIIQQMYFETSVLWVSPSPRLYLSSIQLHGYSTKFILLSVSGSWVVSSIWFLSKRLPWKFLHISMQACTIIHSCPWFQLSAISVTSAQLWSENIKWKIPEVNNSWVLNCMSFWVAWWNLVLSYSLPPQMRICSLSWINMLFTELAF